MEHINFEYTRVGQHLQLQVDSCCRVRQYADEQKLRLSKDEFEKRFGKEWKTRVCRIVGTVFSVSVSLTQRYVFEGRKRFVASLQDSSGMVTSGALRDLKSEFDEKIQACRTFLLELCRAIIILKITRIPLLYRLGIVISRFEYTLAKRVG